MSQSNNRRKLKLELASEYNEKFYIVRKQEFFDTFFTPSLNFGRVLHLLHEVDDFCRQSESWQERCNVKGRFETDKKPITILENIRKKAYLEGDRLPFDLRHVLEDGVDDTEKLVAFQEARLILLEEVDEVVQDKDIRDSSRLSRWSLGLTCLDEAEQQRRKDGNGRRQKLGDEEEGGIGDEGSSRVDPETLPMEIQVRPDRTKLNLMGIQAGSEGDPS
ncbi:hypothetical protein WN55_00945 [Dufourea novaeangliae]|uniref:Uncharacterized protein n=1 Tax=Dufourea novaeangliae TaxID=178035 RepID=A0A154PBC1_DUFNO|nr:hypothetical protein WN55_00945 [Dufourea novaeangliae]